MCSGVEGREDLGEARLGEARLGEAQAEVLGRVGQVATEDGVGHAQPTGGVESGSSLLANASKTLESEAV